LNIPSNLKYTKEHEWVKIEGNIATVGITDYAQGELGDIVFVEFSGVGEPVEQGAVFGTIEAVKAVSEMYSPLGGKIAEVNIALEDDPVVVNQDPYGAGWMVRIEIADKSELDKLLDATSYESIISG